MLSKNKFSLIISATTNCASVKVCAVVVQYVNKDENVIKTAMFDFVNVYEGNEAASIGEWSNLRICDWWGIWHDGCC